MWGQTRKKEMSKISRTLSYEKSVGLHAGKRVLGRGYDFHLSKDLKEMKPQTRDLHE